ncbi:hypothetical protein PV325_000746 [Microctonus aethiopoides]|uniref:Apoptogenic protein 1, mitochondrial n=1 Tax=Microctonus aethiopoides TaxID=144406 RepID=A0AA39EZK3_9HYME|nr:hypothetical protein PV325_000746 [Microctonus aethiopoides]KAK0160787.1 hypothetical protein PV328_008156 [Microctonus aethiopoides]
MMKFCSYQNFKYCRNFNRLYSTTLPNLKISKESSKTGDIIGPPDELSNLRPIIFAKPDNETETEKKYRLAKEKTQEWNQEFWSKHNAKFIQERKEFQKNLTADGKSITADEMSVFYKSFLDRTWIIHLTYNISWYKQNIRNLFLEMKVRLSKLKFK